ncbi:MAG: hypothetical protein AAF843_21475 [Bacteroidota bacterium]
MNLRRNSHIRYSIPVLVYLMILSSCGPELKEAQYDTGELEKKWYEKEGSIEGELREYYKSGKLKKTQQYTSGVLNGEEITYYDNGNIAQVFNYYRGERVGIANIYNRTGTKIETQHYDSSGLMTDFTKFGSDGKQTGDMALLIMSKGDTLSMDQPYVGSVRMGNISNESYNTGTLIIAKEWNEGLPLDTILSVQSNENYYPFELLEHKGGDNFFEACIFYRIPLDSIDGVLVTQRCFEENYYVTK